MVFTRYDSLSSVTNAATLTSVRDYQQPQIHGFSQVEETDSISYGGSEIL